MSLMIHQRASQRLEALEQNVTARSASELRGEVRQLLSTYPDFSPALQRLAAFQEQTAEFSDALQSLQRVVALNPHHVESWVGLARLLHERLHESDRALQALNRALELKANHAAALALRLEIERKKTEGLVAVEAGSPVISAVVSAYKSERFLRGCLEDLERQSIASQLEIIVIDSASPQNEQAIVKEFQLRYPNIVYIRTDTRETVYGAWNRGVKAARGRFVTNANTDDRHRVDALEILVRTLEENPGVTLAYADCLITQIENETFESTHATRRFQWLEFSKTDLLTKGCFVGPQPVWRREVHDEHGYFDAEFVSAGDYEFWLRIARNHKFLHVRQCLGLYLESPTSVEHANRERGAKETQLARTRYAHEILHGYKPAARSTAVVPAKPSPQVAARPLPACARVGDLRSSREKLEHKQFSEAWTDATTAIPSRPYHPEGFLLLAKIALAAGDSANARLWAQHARELAPNWTAPKQFLQKPFKGTARPEWVKPPAKVQSRLSVCVIAKNEEQFLERCLRSVRQLADQLVVVDTGSTDRTIEIAKSFGAEVHHFDWCDDFGAARNATLEHARGDWVLILDADEELPADQHAALRADMNNRKLIALRLPLVNQGQEAEGRSCVPRLFRNAPGVYYEGRIHEQVFPSLIALGNAWGLGTGLGTAQILHHGYAKETVRDRNKTERNLNLLRLAIQERPEDPNLAMNLGLELVRSGDLAGGLPYYRRAFALMSQKTKADIAPELCEALLTQFTSHLYKVRAHEEVVEVLNSSLAKNWGLTASLHFALGLAYYELTRYPEAAEQLRQCLTKRQQSALTPINTDILTAAPHHCLAMSLARAGEVAGAEKAFQAGMAEQGRIEELKLDYARFLVEQNRPVEALHRLHELVCENSHSLAGWRLGAKIALSRPDFLEFACDWTSEAIKQFPQDQELSAQRAEALLLTRQTTPARELWENLWKQHRQPRALAALIFCEMVEDRPSDRSADYESEIGPIGRGFIEWYQRCLDMHARAMLDRVNERTQMLRSVLPAAAAMIEAALAEAGEQPKAASEPCLA